MGSVTLDAGDDSVLVHRPFRASGRNISQTPLSRAGSAGIAAGPRKLKSPTTLTYSAFGAQTAKWVPVDPSIVIGRAPSFS